MDISLCNISGYYQIVNPTAQLSAMSQRDPGRSSFHGLALHTTNNMKNNHKNLS